MDYTTPNPDNQFNSNQLDDDMNEEPAHPLPLRQYIPTSLKVINQWVCWDYHKHADGHISRIKITEPTTFDIAMRRAITDHVGLAFMLTHDDPFATIHIPNYASPTTRRIHDMPQKVMSLVQGYVETDPFINDMFILAAAESAHNIQAQDIAIYFDGQMVPISGASELSADIQNCTDAFDKVARRFCSPSWMERFASRQGEAEEYTVLMETLEECLLQGPDWLQDAHRTDLYTFLAHCWGYPRLQAMVFNHARSHMMRKTEIDVLVDILEQTRKDIGLGKNKERQTATPDPETTPQFDDDLPTIEHVETDYASSVENTMSALIASGAALWQRDGRIVSVRQVPIKSKYATEQKMSSMRIIDVGKSHLLKLATTAAHHFTIKYGKNGNRTSQPSGCPPKIIDMLQEEMKLDFDPLLAITTLPTLRPDGSIISTPGYDAQTWLYYQPNREYPTPLENPTMDDARKALQRLKEPFVDFDFVQGCHESAAITAILGIMARHLVGNTPLVTITANSRGTGKTLLFDVIAMIATGEEIPKSPFPNKDEEMEKQLLAHAIEGARVICFDNIKGTFGSAPLDRVLTSQYIKGRILSKSENAQINMLTNFFATGNNLQYGDDTSRRSLPIAITSDMERPEERTGLTHPDLLRWVRDNQPRLAMAALTILQAYVLAEMPKQDLPPFGGFQDWSDIVRSAIVWLGMTDPCEGRKIVEDENDTETEKLRTLISAWQLAYGSIEKELKDVMKDVYTAYAQEQKGIKVDKPEMIDLGYALAAYDTKSNDRIADISISRLAQHMPAGNGKSRPVEGRCLAYTMDKRKKTKSYRIESVATKKGAEAHDSPGEHDDSGLTYNYNNDLDNLPF